MILIPIWGWALIVSTSVLAAYWSPARTLALALGASWLLSLGAFYALSVPVRPTANSLIDFFMFSMALSQWRKTALASGIIIGLSVALLCAHFAFAWHGAARQARYEDVVNLLFIMECIAIGGAGAWHRVVVSRAGRLTQSVAALRSDAERIYEGGRHGS